MRNSSKSLTSPKSSAGWRRSLHCNPARWCSVTMTSRRVTSWWPRRTTIRNNQNSCLSVRSSAIFLLLRTIFAGGVFIAVCSCWQQWNCYSMLYIVPIDNLGVGLLWTQSPRAPPLVGTVSVVQYLFSPLPYRCKCMRL